MRELVDYHHFRVGEVAETDRVARCEQWVVKALLESELRESERESSVTFELKHHHSVAQFARVLARKRGLPVGPCTVGALLHDIYVIAEGTYADHAHLGLPIAEAVLDEIGGFSREEREIVARIVYHHSDKHLWSEDPYIEFGKDVDVLDCFLYPGAFGFYLRHKRLEVFDHYLRRARLVWAEIGMPPDERFEILAGYKTGWFEPLSRLQGGSATETLASMLASCDEGEAAPPFLVSVREGGVGLSLNKDSWGPRFDSDLRRDPGAQASAVAANLLELSTKEGAGLLVWPALDSFELVGEGDARYAELGL